MVGRLRRPGRFAGVVRAALLSWIGAALAAQGADSAPRGVGLSGNDILRIVGEGASQPATHRTLSWDADGKSLLLSTQSGFKGRIERLDTASGQLTRVVTGFAPKLSADRQLVAYRTDSGSITIARFAGNRFARIAHLETQPPGAAAESASPEYEWSLAGQRLIYRRFTQLTSADARGDRFGRQPEIWLFDAATLKARAVYQAPDRHPGSTVRRAPAPPRRRPSPLAPT